MASTWTLAPNQVPQLSTREANSQPQTRPAFPERGHGKALAQMLFDKGAGTDAQVGRYGNVPQTAPFYGIEEVVQLLLDSGENVNVYG